VSGRGIEERVDMGKRRKRATAPGKTLGWGRYLRSGGIRLGDDQKGERKRKRGAVRRSDE